MEIDVDKFLELTPLPESAPQKDIFPVFEAATKDLYPKVPDPSFDYLFTNWGDKEPEEPYEKAEKKRPDSTRLEKPLKKRQLQFQELTDEQRDIVGKVEGMESATRLKTKGWEKWNDSDWKDAKRRVKTKRPQEDVKELIDLQHKVVGEAVKLRSQALMEMNIFNIIYKAAMVANHPDAEKEEGKEQIYKKISHIVDSVVKGLDLKTSDSKKYEEDEVIGINYKVKIGDEYAIHTHFIKGSKIFLFSLWDKHENRLLLMLCEGYLREDHYLIGTAQSRLKSWMREHGN